MKFKRMLFTGLYTGFFPVAPGTIATGLAAALYAGEYLLFGEYGRWVNAVAVAVFFFPSLYLCGEGEKYFGEKDPGGVVLDEVMGYWVSVLFHPFSWTVLVAAFFFFRIADIIKPFPARRLERLRGGTGILLDDIVAGLYANAAVTALMVAIGAYAMPWL